MGHDDPNDPHHRHAPSSAHEHDELLARPAPNHSVARSPRPELSDGIGRGNVVHLDCFSGLAGDMIVAALLDLGVPRTAMLTALDALPLSGYSVGTEDVERSAIVATRFVVRVDDPQPYRTYRDVRAMIESAKLDDGTRTRALETFRVLAIAEGRVHRIAPEDVHFHEVGAVDSIVDVVAASAGLAWLGAKVSCAPLPMGRGFAKTEHGIIPLPAPAVVEVLAGIPTQPVPLEVELVTPTGAAIVRANATAFCLWPNLAPVATGFGAGTRTLPDRPNLLRVVLGTPLDGAASEDTAYVVVETNIDDASGELLAHVTDALFRAGALDAWTSPIGMKKGRPAVMVSALGPRGLGPALAEAMLRESTSLGVRLKGVNRLERPRRMVEVETKYGRVPLKVADGDGLPQTAKPEDAVVGALAEAQGVTAREVSAEALRAFWRS